MKQSLELAVLHREPLVLQGPPWLAELLVHVADLNLFLETVVWLQMLILQQRLK
jgi:hypothetical protein